MKRRSWLASLGAILVVSCSSAPDTTTQTSVTQPAPGVAQAPSGKPQFTNPVVNPTATVDVPAVPGLLKPTYAKARLPGIAMGRPDPFAALATPPIKLVAAAKPATSLPRSRPTTALAPLPTSALTPLPTVPLAPLPTVPVTVTPGALPLLPTTPLAPTSIIDEIEITGAMQVGGKWSVIVKESDAQTSRYVSTGSYLAGGRVLVKRIVAGAGTDPIVILQHNGIEVTKSLGSSSGSIASK